MPFCLLVIEFIWVLGAGVCSRRFMTEFHQEHATHKPKSISLSKRTILAIFTTLIVTNVIFVSWALLERSEGGLLDEKNVKDYGISYDEDFMLLDPEIAELSVNDFVKVQDNLVVRYMPLRTQVIETIDSTDPDGVYGFYFEDLETGSWVGINEKEKFIPASLFKVHFMIAVLKNVEDGKMSINDKVTLTEEDLDSISSVLYSKGPGFQVSVRDLLHFSANESDNTAIRALSRQVSVDDVFKVSVMTGFPLPKINGTKESALVSSKEYSNVFRSLYFSNYLKRPFSQFALSILSKTSFNSGIPAGVPSDVSVAHKVGFWEESGSYHDCGIVYSKGGNYLICVMSSNTHHFKADETTRKISKVVYDYVNSE